MPHDELIRRFQESGLTLKELSRRVQAGAHDTTVATPRRIRDWFGGAQPRDAWLAEIVAEVLSDACGQVVTAEDLGLLHGSGWSTAEPWLTSPWTRACTVKLLNEHARSDLMQLLTRRHALGATVVTGGALTEPVQRWTTVKPDKIPIARGAIGSAQVERIKQVTTMFREADFKFGGGLSRDAVVAQLHWASSQLHGPFANEQVGRQFFAAVADLAEHAGWMSFDAGLHGPAQRYFVLGLRVAKEYEHRPLIADVASCLALQMIYVGHPDDALDLIQHAQHVSRDQASPLLQSMLKVVEARAHAKLGHMNSTDRWRRIEAVRRCVTDAEDLFTDRSLHEVDPWLSESWLRYFDETELAGDTGNAWFDLAPFDGYAAQESEQRLQRAVTGFGDDYARSRAFSTVKLATLRLTRGEPEEAGQILTSVFHDMEQMNSARVANDLHEFTGRAQRYRDVPEIQELTKRLSTFTKVA